MLIDSLTFALEKSDAFATFWGKLDAHADSTLGAAGSVRPFLVAARYNHHPQPTLVVVAGEESALTFARNVAAYVGDEHVVRFPQRQDVPGGSAAISRQTVARRMQAAHMLQTGANVIVVASAASLIRLMAPASSSPCRPLVLRAGAELADMGLRDVAEFDDVPRELQAMGYRNTGELEGPGTYSVRGGVIDVFPAQLVYPVRLDFFGDLLEEIRRIVPSTGQTITALDEVSIYPAREFRISRKGRARALDTLGRRAATNPAARTLLEQVAASETCDATDALGPLVYGKGCTLGDYLSDNVLVSLIEPRSLFDDIAHASDDVVARLAKTGYRAEDYFAAPGKVNFGDTQRATYVSLMRLGGEVDEELPVKRVDVAGHPDKLYGKLTSLIDDGYTVVFSAPNYRVRQDMKLAFVDHCLPIQEALDVIDGSEEKAADADRNSSAKGGAATTTAGPATTAEPAAATAAAAGPATTAAPAAAAAGPAASPSRTDNRAHEKRRLRRGVVNIVDVDIPLGMIIPKARLAMISASDTQGSSRAGRSRHVDITEVTFPFHPGDYVVHAAHGVAHFADLVRREVDGTERDYLLLEYDQGDKLYVPVEQLDRVTRYVGPEGSTPRLTRLNTADWTRTLAKTRKAAKTLAFDLVDVYSRRAAAQGFRFGPDTPWQRQMEDAFPYQETADQLAAIEEVKADMCSAKPMDRLICGDVGFGKTEVALRAAFKATQDAKQVLVLCPTTILAQQHYTNFKERCEPFGVTVEVLSRFRSPAQQKAALDGLRDGSVDILVGTHRLLSRDVNPHDLGLVIIDEEQRFGVGHKEQFKNMRESVDVLTLSATPIPRTMQMAVSGVRDMSLILTPPDERRPVEVHVGEWDPDLVSGAIRRELARGGQVYYVSNRVRSIDEAVERVKAAAGEARIGVGHGQMAKEQLERVMEDFSAGQLDVLVATTIIESGIDNPHTNTLIIEDSQRLGLAQLYQLKGRVGRSATQAYAYFMFPEHSTLTEEATARLLALNEHQDLGSGMRIALRDLEIRGAGSLLGAEQSGNMSAVGFDLFAQMIATAINEAREGGTTSDALPPALSDITVNIPGKAFFSEDYIPAADERVLWYRRLASAATIEEVDEIAGKVSDAHGDSPPEADNLIAKSRIKAFAHAHGIDTVSVVAGKLIVEPVTIGKQAFVKMRRCGARYTEQSRKLALPLKYFGLTTADDLFAPIAEFLEALS